MREKGAGKLTASCQFTEQRETIKITGLHTADFACKLLQQELRTTRGQEGGGHALKRSLQPAQSRTEKLDAGISQGQGFCLKSQEDMMKQP